LINYNDCPSSLDSLIPDNGLANLAGSLLSRGHETKILDYSTIQTLEDFRPAHVRRKLKSVFLRYLLETSLFGKMSASTYKAFRDIDNDIASCRDDKIQKIIKEIIEEIESGKIDFVAFKLWSGEGFLGSAKIAHELRKKFPRLKIFGGGPHVEIYGKRIFSFTDAFDVLCQGEGEEIIAQLAEFAEGKRNINEIPSIIYKDGAEIVSTNVRFIDDLNAISDPVYDEDVYPAMKGDEKLKIIMIEESRGCPYSCNFCIHRIKSGNRWRTQRVDKIIANIKKLSEQVNTCAFKFSGSNTPYFLRKEIAESLIKERMNIKYIGFADTRQPEKEDYALLKKSGCVSLFFGVESADPHLLENVMNKKTDPQWIRDSLKQSGEAGILVAASIIAPCPGERSDSIQKTINLLSQAKICGVSVYPAVCYPRTRWFAESEKFGFKLAEDAEDKMMTYTIKFTMPPPMTAPLPFTIDGKNFSIITEEIIKTSRALEKKGITTGMNDSLLFFGHILGMHPSKVKALNQRSMILGDYSNLREKIRTFNARVRLHQ